MKQLMRCNACFSYTLKNSCPKCNEKTITPKPPKYSPEDKYAKYRKIAKFEERKKGDLI